MGHRGDAWRGMWGHVPTPDFCEHQAALVLLSLPGGGEGGGLLMVRLPHGTFLADSAPLPSSQAPGGERMGQDRDTSPTR